MRSTAPTKQYVDELTWTPGLDPKTGKPLNYDPTKDVQVYAPGSHGMRGQGPSKTCPSHNGGKNWEPSAYNPELGLLFIPSTEGCDSIVNVEQKSFVDQGGTVKPRERFGGGQTKNLQPRRYGSLKSVDPATGEIKASVKMTYPNYGGVLATAGNLVFIGQLDGTLYAYDARTLREVWSFNAGTGINAPPITYSVNGKQYIAVLMGSKQTAAVWEDSPELKNTSTASMLYVFAL
jgi:alcohol dehydrogenase (cytochrome c)